MKMKWLQLMLLLAVIGVTGNAVADNTWTGAGADDLWSNPTNWSGGHVPVDSDLNIFMSALNDAGNDMIIIDSAVTTSLNCDLYGPEWGLYIDIDGGSLTQVYDTPVAGEGFVLAPVGDAGADSVIDVHNGGSLTVQEMLIGDNWWFSTAPGAIMNVYDTSTVTANGWCWLGGKLNLYGGTVLVTGGFNMNAGGQNYAHIDIEEGELILGYGDATDAVNTWISTGELTAYGLTPGRGADIVIDTESISGSTIVSAVYKYPATNPTPADGSTGAGTAVSADLVDVSLEWWCGADPNKPVNPDVLTHYIYMTDGSDTDPNLYYTGVSVAQASQTDPNNSYLMEDLSENTLYQWSIVEGLDDGTSSPYAPGDPNNIFSPIWSFTTKAAQPILTDPVNAIADPNATFTVEDTAGAASSYQWHQIDGSGADTALSDTGAYSGALTNTLTVTNATVAEEGLYYCVATNGDKTDTSDTAYLWTQRLMGHWKFEQNMLDSVTDDVTGAPTHDGAIEGDGPGDANYAAAGGPDSSDAMEFNNDGDFVAIGGDPNFFNFYPLGFTVSFWYKQNAPIGTNAWRVPMSKLDPGVGGWLFGVDDEFREWALFFTNPGDAVENWADGYIDMNGDGQNDINIGDGGWHMISAIYDPATTSYTIFTDGDQNESVVLDLSSNPLPEAPLSIGGRITELSIDGFIDDVRIYSYPMTPLEMAQMYTAIETDAWVCVEDSEDPLSAFDLNGDCKVNLPDFAEFASNWLKCQRYPASGCDEL